MDNLCLETLFKRCLTSCQIEWKELSRQQHGTIQRALWSLADFPISQNLTNLIFLYFVRQIFHNVLDEISREKTEKKHPTLNPLHQKLRFLVTSPAAIYRKTAGWSFASPMDRRQMETGVFVSIPDTIWAVMGQESCLGTRKNCWLMDGNSLKYGNLI